jgi:hypothetical protein
MIFTSGGMTTSNMDFMAINVTKFQPGAELLALFPANDLRRVYYIRGTQPNLIIQKYANRTVAACSDVFVLRLPEVYLNRAEALVMLDRDDEAIADLQSLRACRLADPGAINLSDSLLLALVRDERRRELCFEGQRWFDLRRYAVYPTWNFQREIRHPYYEYTSVSGDMVLKTFDEEPRYYTLAIPENEILLNGGALEQNPAREWKETEPHL